MRTVFLNSDRVQQFTQGRWLNLEQPLEFSGVSYAQYIKGNIYFPVNPGQLNMESINKYIDAGIRAIVLDDESLAQQIKIPVLLVDKVSIALAKVAHEVRQQVNPKAVLITGTEGKTGTKLQLGQLLERQAKVHYIPNSQNNLHSVYRTLADLEADDQIELTEVGCGANTDLNRRRGRAVNPDFVFYTRIGMAHMDFHKTIDGLLTNKASVLAGLRDGGVCLVNSTMDGFDNFLHKLQQEKPGVSILTYGERSSDTAKVLDKQFDKKRLGWQIKSSIEGEIVTFFHPLFHQFVPVMSSGILLLIKRLGYDIQKAAQEFIHFRAYETMGQLLELKRGDDRILLYNQSRRGGGINSITSAFADLKNFDVKGKVVALLGSMSVKEDEQNTLELHRDTAYEINNSKISRLYTTGVHMEIVRQYLDKPEIFVKHNDDFEALLEDLLAELEDGDLLFVKGHASLSMTRLVKKILKHKAFSHPYKIVKGVITLP